MDTIYERIKRRRRELGLSVDDVAAALGISKATVYRYESADIEKVPATSLAALAKVLRTTPAYLMGWEADQPAPEYYQDPKTTAIAQKLLDTPGLRILFDAAQDSRPEDLQMAADLLERLKRTNPDG